MFGIVLFWGISLIFLLFVYYGTSFEATPLRLLYRPLQFLRSSPARAELSKELVRTLEILRRSAELEGAQGRRLENAVAYTPRPIGGVVDEAKSEAVISVLNSSAYDAAKLADKMERRINTHLILGVLVGLVGLLIWYYSFFIGGRPTDKIHSWTEMVPRISILLFIELLAGFFLQQYRIGVEDLKYFLELERRADANRVAYAIFDKLGDTEAKRDFARSLMAVPSDTRLETGQTTTSLEALKSQENVMLKALGILGDQMESVTKLLRKEK